MDEEVMDENASEPNPRRPRGKIRRAESQRNIRKTPVPETRPDSDVDLETFVFSEVKQMFKKRARRQKGLFKVTRYPQAEVPGTAHTMSSPEAEVSGAAHTASSPEAEDSEESESDDSQVEQTEEFQEEYKTDLTSFTGLMGQLKSIGFPDKGGEDLKKWSEDTTKA